MNKRKFEKIISATSTTNITQTNEKKNKGKLLKIKKREKLV